jgi:hypothetical protein
MSNPKKGGTKMGYYKQLLIELEDIHDPHMREVVLWKRAHEHKMTPEQLWEVMVDEVKMQQALALWRNEENLPAPRSASSHVSLLHVQDENPRAKSYLYLTGWALVIVALVAGVTVVVVSL